jgi:hypothetical protein
MFMKKIFSIISASILAGLFVSCNVSDKQVSSVTVDFNSSHTNALIPALTSSSPSTTVIPVEVATLQLKVYASTQTEENVIFNQTFDRSVIDSNGTVTLDILAGPSRIFVVNAYDSAGVLRYSDDTVAQPAPHADLVVDTSISISINMLRVNLTLDAALDIDLEGEDGSAYANPGYLDTTVKTFSAEVYIPTVTNGVVDLSTPISTPVSYVGIPSLSKISGLSAYPKTYQVVMVRAFTVDGKIAAIGGVVISNLASGSNSRTVKLVRPGALLITNTQNSNAPISTILVEQYFTSGWKQVSNTFTIVDPSQQNVALVLVPNSVAIWGTSDPTVAGTVSVALQLRFTINGVLQPVVTFDGTKPATTSKNDYIRWKTLNVTF